MTDMLRRCTFIVLGSVLAVGWSPHAAAEQAPTAPPPTIGVDVSITQAVVNAEGVTVDPAVTQTKFRLERRHTPSGWQTVIRYPATPSASATRATATPLDGARLEYDDGARGARVYDREGRLNPHLSVERDGAGLPPFDGAARWIESLLAEPQHSADRRAGLRRAYGAPAGRLRGLDRYVSRNGESVEEILADPQSGVVVENNVSRDGTLDSRVRFEYARRADGSLFRHTIRTEQAMNESGGRRAVVTVAFSNLSMGGR